MTSCNWSKKARSSSKAGASAADEASSSSAGDAAAGLRQWLLSSRGKGLLELVEALGGKPVTLKVSQELLHSHHTACIALRTAHISWAVSTCCCITAGHAPSACSWWQVHLVSIVDTASLCASILILKPCVDAWVWRLEQGAAAGKASSGGSSKADPIQQLLAVYEAALNHLRAQGALLNTVRAEYLLSEGDFQKLMEDRTASAAGNPELEEALDCYAAVEASFGAYSAMAWNCVLLQVGR